MSHDSGLKPVLTRAARFAALAVALLLAVGAAFFLTLSDPSLRGAPIVAILGALGLAAILVLLLVGWSLARDLARITAVAEMARAESERRAHLMAAVADASHRLARIEAGSLIEGAADCATALGFGAVLASVCGTGRAALEVVRAGEAPTPEGTMRALRASVEEARRGGVTVVRGSGRIVACATPVVCDDETEAILAGSLSRDPLPEEIEALELLAAQAGIALESARRLERERRSVERLAELDRLKKNFLATVSHEFRTPLSAIRGMGRTLAERWPDLPDEVRAEFLDRLNANAVVLDGIIATLLDYSRIEAGKLEVRPEPVNLAGILRETASRLRDLFVEHHLIVVIDGDLTVAADPALVDRVIENLLANAAKHTPPGTEVELSGRIDRGDVVVAVTDRGPGIDPDDVKHLGERFFRGNDLNRNRARGTGLGLAIAREVIELHGGRMEIESVLGEGSRFAFRIPRVAAPVVEAAEALSAG